MTEAKGVLPVLPTMPVIVPATLCVVAERGIVVATSLEGEWLTSEAPDPPLPGTMATGVVLVMTGRARDTVTLLTPLPEELALPGVDIFVIVATKINKRIQMAASSREVWTHR